VEEILAKLKRADYFNLLSFLFLLYRKKRTLEIKYFITLYWGLLKTVKEGGEKG
jgi:hypothetical protein